MKQFEHIKHYRIKKYFLAISMLLHFNVGAVKSPKSNKITLEINKYKKHGAISYIMQNEGSTLDCKQKKSGKKQCRICTSDRCSTVNKTFFDDMKYIFSIMQKQRNSSPKTNQFNKSFGTHGCPKCQ